MLTCKWQTFAILLGPLIDLQHDFYAYEVLWAGLHFNFKRFYLNFVTERFM